MKNIRKVEIHLDEKNDNRTAENVIKISLALIPIVIIVSSLFFFDVKPLLFGKVKFQTDIADMIQPQSLQQTFRYIELPNQMKGMLISDPKEIKASAAVRVNTGAGEDPLNFAGVAHLLEHVLHLGTKRFPSDQEYKYILSKNGGSSNAFTSDECTTYFFGVNNGALDKVLNVFSSFFEEPLFDKNVIEREANAVHSEHEKNLVSDGRRFYQVLRDLSHKDHKFNRFTTGNLETLLHKDGEDDLTKVIKRFYRKHYVATNMQFTILGNYPLEELENMAIKYFSNVNTQEKSLDYDLADSKEGFEPKSTTKVSFSQAFSLAFSNEPLTHQIMNISKTIPEDKGLNFITGGRFSEKKSNQDSKDRIFKIEKDVKSEKSILKSKSTTSVIGKPFLERAYKKLVEYESIGSSKTLSVALGYTGSSKELDKMEDYLSFIDKFLSNSDSNSLYGKLKVKGYIQSINSWFDRTSEDSKLFIIRFRLTDLGLTNYEKIASIFYSYIEKMKLDVDNLKVEDQTLIDYLNFIYGYQSSAVGTTLHFVKKVGANPTNYMMESVQLDYSKEEMVSILSKISPENSLIILGKPEDNLRFVEHQVKADMNVKSIDFANGDEGDEKHKRTIDTILENPTRSNKESCEKCEIEYEDALSKIDEFEMEFEGIGKKSKETGLATKNPKMKNVVKTSKSEIKPVLNEKQKKNEKETPKNEIVSPISKGKSQLVLNAPKVDSKVLSKKPKEDIPEAHPSLFSEDINSVKKFTNTIYKFNYKVSILSESKINELKSPANIKELEVNFPRGNRFIPEDISLQFTPCESKEIEKAKEVATEQVTATATAFLVEKFDSPKESILPNFLKNILKRVNSNKESLIGEECMQGQIQSDRDLQNSKLFSNQSGFAVYFKTARQFKLPKTEIRFKINNQNLLDSSLYTYAKLDAAILNEMIKENLFDALLFSHIKVSTSNEGYLLKVESFSNKANEILKNLLQMFSNSESASENTFDNIKQRFVQALKDFKVGQPLTKAASFLENMIYKDSPLAAEILTKMEAITFKDYKEKISSIRQGKNYKALFFGNVVEKDMTEIAPSIKENLKSPATLSFKESFMPVTKLNEGSSYVLRFENENPKDVNNGVFNYYQFGKLTEKERLMISYMTGPLRSTAFNHIRTRKQMGYIVSVGIENESKIYGVKIMAQGSFASTHAMEREVEASLMLFHTYLKDELDQASIDDFISSFKAKRKVEDFTYQSTLEWIKFEPDYIENIVEFSKTELIEFFEKYFIKESRKISIQVYSQKKKEDLNSVLGSEENISGKASILLADISEIKKMGYYE